MHQSLQIVINTNRCFSPIICEHLSQMYLGDTFHWEKSKMYVLMGRCKYRSIRAVYTSPNLDLG